ncbi:cytochrome b-c1 complex subunit 10 [Peromyscus maniculatus bairdii]|nr:cytochrome b-c1 complex subunit 10 [Peromyscus maniculatus bairdii]XP_028717027.1 cytochrome b-c1 complex subunit 10 [Peromyscus leucopus]
MRSAPGQRERGDPECRDPAAMLGKFLGPRYRELAKNWVPTASMWGAVGAVGLVWATDWRLILDWVPYINGKFKKDN